MGAILGLIGGVIGILVGLFGLAFSLFFGLMGLLVVFPLAIIFSLLGILFWDPLVWVALAVVIYLLYRMGKKKGYIKKT